MEIMKKIAIINMYKLYGGVDCNIVTTYERHRRNQIATRCVY